VKIYDSTSNLSLVLTIIALASKSAPILKNCIIFRILLNLPMFKILLLESLSFDVI